MISESIIQCFDTYKILKVNRKNSYKIEDHLSVKINLTKGELDREKLLAKRLTGLNVNRIGKVIDYEVPIRDTNHDKKVGDIDLISYNSVEKKLYLIELKSWRNEESLLRAVLEIYTYFNQVDKNKLIQEYCSDKKFVLFKAIECEGVEVVPAVLLTDCCNPFEEKKKMENGGSPQIKKLIKILGIKLFDLKINCY